MEDNKYPNYCCQDCGEESQEFGGEYETINGKKYPIFTNERKYYNGTYDMHDWDETHYCKNCKKEYTFSTGAV